MMNVPENELFSAYLDGELTAEEQAKVEELLAASPEARQLMDELRALGSSLQSLPLYRPEEDLSGRVLRLAERRILAEPAEPHTHDARPQPAEAERQPIFRRLLRPRALVWSGLAVAVALMLVVTQQREGPQLAMGPEKGKAPERGPSIRAVQQKAFKGAPARGEPVAQDAPHAAPDEKPAVAEEYQYVDERRPGKGGPTPGFTAPPAESVRQAVADKEPEPETRAKDALAKQVESPAPGGAATVVGGRPPDRQLQTTGPPARQPTPADRLAVDEDQTVEKTQTTPARPAKGQPPLAGPGAQPPDQQQQPTTAVALQVRCDISAEAAREGVLDQLLAKQQITRLETADIAVHKDNGSRAAGASRAANREQSEPMQAAQLPSETISVDVEATPAEIQAILADLKARPEDFRSLSILPNLGRVTVQVQGLKTGAMRRPFPSREFLGDSAGNPLGGGRTTVGFDAAPSSAKAAPGPGIRVQFGVKVKSKVVAPADAKPGWKVQQPPALETEEAKPALRGLEGKGTAGAIGVTPAPRAKLRVRFVLHVLKSELPAAADYSAKKADPAAKPSAQQSPKDVEAPDRPEPEDQ